MNKSIVFVVCETFRQDVSAALEALGWTRARIAVVRCQCHLSEPASVEPVAAAIAQERGRGYQGPIILLGRQGALAGLLPADTTRGLLSSPDQQCAELIAPPRLLAHLQSQGAFTVTSGWLSKWEAVIQAWGTNQETARMMFREAASRLVLLETVPRDGDSGRLQEFARYVNLPAEILPLGLDYLMSRLARLVSDWLIDQQEQELGQVSRTTSDSLMVMDMLKDISKTMVEEDIRTKTSRLLEMLMAPRTVRFDSPEGGRALPPEQEGNGDNHDSAIIWVDELAGFRILISYQREALAHVECAGIQFPEYRRHYTQMLHTIVDVLALALKNARAHEALRQRAEELENSIAANKAKSTFLANMSHEIRTPLNGIVGMLRLLESVALTDEQKEYVQAALRTSNRLTRLLSDLLDLSRIETDNLPIQEKEFAVDGLRQSILELFSLAAKEKGLFLDLVLSPGLPLQLIGDEIRVGQILMNLVGNAIKFTQQGGVRVEVSPLHSQDEGSFRCLFMVQDTGMGITDEHLKIIFEPFVQAESSYTRKFQGAGLGLAIVRKLVALMDGDISVDNGSDGTTFYLSIPFRLPGQKRLEASKDMPLENLNSPLRVLLVEDDEMNRWVGTRLLEKAGCVVIPATDGCEAVDLTARQNFDLVFMDVQMPNMDGVTATKTIRIREHQEGIPGVPIIAMTAYALHGDREKFLNAGMDGYIAKPVDMDMLKGVISKAMITSGRRTYPAERQEHV